MQEIARHLSDIEKELSELGRKLEDVRQQIRDVSVMVKPKSELKAQVALKSVNNTTFEQIEKNRLRRDSYPYGSSYRPDRWMNSATQVPTDGIQEAWSVGNENGNSYSNRSVQDELGMTNAYHFARQSEYSIHGRP